MPDFAAANITKAMLDAAGSERQALRQATDYYASGSFGVRLRRAMAAAETNNAVINKPLLLPPAYAYSTAYQVGQVISNVISGTTYWFLCGTAGTSAASGAGPTNITNAQYTTDGTAQFTFLGEAPIAANDAAAPTVTTVTSNPGGQVYNPVAIPSVYKALGATTSPYRTDIWSLSSFTELGGAAQCRGAAVMTETDSALVHIFVPSNSLGIRIIINDGSGPRYLQPGAFNFGGSDTWITLNWAGKGGKKWRTYTVETGKSQSYFGKFQLGATTDQIRAPALARDIRGVAVGDSIIPGGGGSGLGPWLPGNAMCMQMGKMLGIADMWNLSTGGTGWIATNGGAAYTFRQRLPQALTLLAAKPGVLFLGGSSNDIGQTSGDITAAVLATLTDVRTGGFTGPIIVFGVPSINANTVAVEQAVAAGVTAFADPQTYFIPISTDPVPWVFGAWNNTGWPAGTVTSPMLIGSDNIHPVEYGTGSFARRGAAEVRAALQ